MKMITKHYSCGVISELAVAEDGQAELRTQSLNSCDTQSHGVFSSVEEALKYFDEVAQ